ncbi:hypothetical protein Pmar_PMAR005131 [Perkinsus marinus ATCC 50983]|uniref:Uncharacterized protein n=1 Tax=Perkinsus marinus (strain ATCC 50983 / TXsc) TaxID=423536 RepID=C5KAQ0_PERM5|nr:hypothetical protein Pmar_PMAR005131 [Perkinsus marinus ATCC 50983]EER18226.1 hypothetical protein Pmar_PMAR005131 [Perkinsus marinus ATCC 50983]|eukprot:XP_002786430.1 hypothetical protein Pmar_PMAR005131 [Perkinsus marinus ATCC 50983]
MAKRSQMQSVAGGLQNEQQLKMALGSGTKAPSPIPQRGASQGIGAQTTGAKMSQAAVQSLLQSMLSQQQGQQRAGAAVAAAAAPRAQSTIARQQGSNQAAAAAGGPMGRANLGNLNQLYQSLLTQFTHGTAGIRHQGGVTPAGPASPSPSASAAGGGVGSGTRTMPVLQNMLQNIFANNRSGSGYSTATTPKGSGIRAQQGASITATPSLQQQQQQRPPYQQFYYGNAVGGGTSIPSKAVFPGPKAPSPAAAYGNSGGPSGPGV